MEEKKSAELSEKKTIQQKRRTQKNLFFSKHLELTYTGMGDKSELPGIETQPMDMPYNETFYRTFSPKS